MSDVSEFLKKKLITVSDDTSIDEVYNIMTKHKIRHLPVVAGKKILGIISDKDVLKNTLFVNGKKESSSLLARDIMSTDLITAKKFDSIEVIAATLDFHRIHCVPVVDKGCLVGLITSTDVLRYFVSQQLAKGKIAQPLAVRRKMAS